MFIAYEIILRDLKMSLGADTYLYKKYFRGTEQCFDYQI